MVGSAVLLVVRPATGILSFLGAQATWPEGLVVAFFGIRGIGLFHYLSHALAGSSFRERELLVVAEELWSFVGFVVWSFVGFVVLRSITLHGFSSRAVMDLLMNW